MRTHGGCRCQTRTLAPRVRSLGIVGWARSPIMTVGAVEQINWGKDAVVLESNLILPQRTMARIYR